WSGEDCSTRSCPNECNGKGICDNGNCICDITYSGSDCGRRSCVNDCNGHGRCEEESGRCRCNGNWEGDDCSVRRCPRDCSGHGECVDGRCRCWGGWDGISCSEVVQPSGLQISNIQPTTIDVSWTKASSALNVALYFTKAFLLKKSRSRIQNPTSTVLPNKTSVLIKDLSPGETYTVALYAVQGENTSAPIHINFTTCIDKPTHLRVQAVTPTSVIVTWNATQANVEGYSLECIDVRRKHVEEIKASSGRIRTVLEGLEPGTEYLISVFTIYNERGSIPVQLSIKTAIDPPSRLMFVTVSDSAFTIHWQKPVAMVSNYIVTYYRSMGGSTEDEHEVPVKGRKNTSYMLMALRPGILYYVSLATERHERVSFPPVTERFVTSQPLTAPPVVEVQEVSETWVTLGWASQAIDSVEEYHVTYSLLNGTNVLNPPSNLNVTTKSSKSVELTWKSLLNDVDGYVIKYHELESRSRRPNMIMRRNMKVIHMQSNTTVNVTGTFYREYKVSATKRFVFFQNLFPGHEYDVDVATLRKLQKSSSVQVHFKTAKVPYLQPKDCVQVSLNGEKSDDVYEIFPYNGIKLKVFCDLTTDGGGWIVFQRRRDGSVSFDRSWEDYTTGFGNLTSEFWIGLQTLHELTTAMDAPQSLRIDLHHGDDKSYAAYHNFSISNSDDRFVLSASNYSGTAGDSLSYHYGMKFTTYDSDNDEATRNCAKEYKGAWWFKNCHRSSLNGQLTFILQGVNWYTWGGFTRSIDFVEMKIRPR
uniref:Tenascin-R n=1 Tax=Ciona savignyi TaxID=51511 RepID=H2YMB6_CIOSA